MMMPSDASGRLSVRFVDAHSGRNDLLGRVAALEAMAAVVTRRLEGARPGSRFPLQRLVGRPTPLTAVECESLAREVTRLRHLLAALPAAPGGGGGGVPTLSDAPGVAEAAGLSEVKGLSDVTGVSEPTGLSEATGRSQATGLSGAVGAADGGPAPESSRTLDRTPSIGARTLADAFAWPLFVLEHIARLGAASRRGARFEVGDAVAFARDRTPLSPHAARV